MKVILYTGLVIAALILVSLELYLPGVNGPFLLDDFYNLAPLSHVGDIGGFRGAFYFLASNTSGVLGRPVALLSFLLNDTAWPTAPESFKYMNILIHIACALSVFWLCFLVCRQLNIRCDQGVVIAGFTAIIWAVHPINVSTVLYVVQRMTILATLFGLWALISFIYAFSEKLSERKVHLLMIFGFGGFTVLAVLSKESGALIPLYALIIWRILFPYANKDLAAHKIYARVLLAAPLLLILYFAYEWQSLMSSYRWRDFSLSERLLTEARVLMGYLSSIAIPSQVRATLYFDDLVLSKSIFDPVSTLISILSIVGLLLISVFLIVKRKQLIIALGIAWYFVGHLLESTVVPLEIAFEHRNYFPSIGPIFAIVFAGWQLLQFIESRIIKLVLTGVFVAVIALVSLLTSQHVHSWSSWPQLIFTWAFDQPDSKRAQMEFVEVVAKNGQPYKAIEILQDFSKAHPNDLAVRIRLDVMECQYKGSLSDPVVANSVEKLNVEQGALLGEIQRYIDQARFKNCPEITEATVRELLSAIKAHKNVAYRSRIMTRILDTQASYEAELGNYIASIKYLDEAAKRQKTVDIPLKQAVISWQAGEYAMSLKYIQKCYEQDALRSWKYPSRVEEIKGLEEIVEKSMREKNG